MKKTFANVYQGTDGLKLLSCEFETEKEALAKVSCISAYLETIEITRPEKETQQREIATIELREKYKAQCGVSSHMCGKASCHYTEWVERQAIYHQQRCEAAERVIKTRDDRYSNIQDDVEAYKHWEQLKNNEPKG